MAEGDFPKSDGDILFASEANAFNSMPTAFDILNRINQLEDRSVTLSLGSDDLFTEAYIDADGRENSVTTGNTTAIFRASTETGISRNTYFIDNFTEGSTTETITESNTDATDNNWGFTVTAVKSCFISRISLNCNSSGTVTLTLKRGSGGPTLATKSGVSVSSGTNDIDFVFGDYDNDELPLPGQTIDITINSSGSPAIHKDNSKTYSGTLVSGSGVFPGNGGGIIAKEVVGATSTTKVIEHAIPSGTFSSTVSKIRGKAKINSTEGDAKIEHRLENATENSGWHVDGVSGTFTAFTSEPTKYIVRLTSKTTGTPTPGIPSVNGSGVYSE